MIDTGLLRRIAALQHADDLNTRDLTAHGNLEAMRLYIRKAGPADAAPVTAYAQDLGWRDPGGAFESVFARSAERLARAGIDIRHVQIAYSQRVGWLPRLKLFACLEGQPPREAPGLLALWRAFGAPLDLAQQLARDGEGQTLEHVAAIFGEGGDFASGETYVVPSDPRIDCISVERDARVPASVTTSLYTAWSTPIRPRGLSRIAGASLRDAQAFMEALGIDGAPAITVSKRGPEDGRERGVSIEIRRSLGEGESF